MESLTIVRWWLGWSLAWLSLSALDAMLIDSAPPVLAFCATFIALSAVLVGVHWSAGALPRLSVGLFVALAAAVVAPFALDALNAPHSVAAYLRGGLALTAAAWLGAALGRGMQAPAHLWPLVIVALSADLWSVTSPSGVTAQLLTEPAQETLSILTLNAPVAGLGIVPVIGMGDVVFVGFLAGACAATGLSQRRSSLETRLQRRLRVAQQPRLRVALLRAPAQPRHAARGRAHRLFARPGPPPRPARAPRRPTPR
jgi:hypothetical protein